MTRRLVKSAEMHAVRRAGLAPVVVMHIFFGHSVLPAAMRARRAEGKAKGRSRPGHSTAPLIVAPRAEPCVSAQRRAAQRFVFGFGSNFD